MVPLPEVITLAEATGLPSVEVTLPLTSCPKVTMLANSSNDKMTAQFEFLIMLLIMIIKNDSTNNRSKCIL